MLPAFLSWAVPSAVSALGMLFGRKKAEPTLDPTQQRLMNQALQMQNQRMLMQNPLFEQITQGAMSRMPRSAMPASYAQKNLGGYLPTMTNPMQRFNPGYLQGGQQVGQAVQAIGRGMAMPDEQTYRRPDEYSA